LAFKIKSKVGYVLLLKLAAARGAKCGVPAGSVAVAAGAASSTSECPPQAAPFQPDAAVKASALPTSKPSTPSISMTAALENVGAVNQTRGEVIRMGLAQHEEPLFLKCSPAHRRTAALSAQSSMDESSSSLASRSRSVSPLRSKNQNALLIGLSAGMASMERLLQEESDRSPPDVIGAGDFNGNPPQDGDNELFNRMATELDQDNQMAVDDDEDDEDEEDEDEECSNGSPGDDEAKELLSNGVGDERQNNGKQLNEEWQSGRRTSHGIVRLVLMIYS
ncbi:hypothetical protein XENOCAPTIV_008663, partial [Xenoophorus captivus]